MAGSELEWTNVTVIHPLGLIALCLALVFALFGKRSIIAVVVMFFLVTIPIAQRIALITLDFNFVRILILIISLRMVLRVENGSITIEKPDKYVLAWAVWSIITQGLLFGGSGIIGRTGYMIEAVGAYMIGRVYLASWEEVNRLMGLIFVASLIFVVFFLVERSTGRNMFSVFGGVPEFTLIREGRMRCQGPFPHPIMAGIFWASVLPWLGAAWLLRTYKRWILLIAGISIVTIVITSASSTPAMAVVFAVTGTLFFPYRRFLPLLRWVTAFTLLILHFVMEKGVWHIIARIDVAGGSTGWHRYHLIDAAISRTEEWWLIGTIETAHWGLGLADITNQYILEGVNSGLLGLLFFVAILVATFKMIGLALRESQSREEERFFWAAGVSLFAHCMNFLAVSYFGQSVSAFFLVLGATVSMTATSVVSQKRA